MSIPLLQPTENPGEFVITATGETVKIVKYKEDDYYDHVYKAAGAVSAGTRLYFFRDIEGKNEIHTNLTTQRHINSSSQMVLSRIGLLPCQAVGNTIVKGDDINKVAYAGLFTFKIGRERIVAQGAVVKFPSGLGVTGSTTDSDRAYVTLGVPSAAAAPQLLVAQPINDKDELFGDLEFQDASWISGYTMPTLAGEIALGIYLHGLISDPSGK